MNENTKKALAAVKTRWGLARFFIVAAIWLAICPTSLAAEPPSPADVARRVITAKEKFWQSCAQPPDSLSARDLFAYALVLCEARQHPERLDRLFELAEPMQDHDPRSRGYGNFRWYRRDTKVMDYNAVDFCMRGGSLLWLKHQEFIPTGARQRLRKMLELSIQGCLKHKVAESYSNIALMNAGDLILLGEALGNGPAAAEGYARLDRVFHYTQAAGIHEFVSPTYTGVDLDGLGMIEAYCRHEAGRVQARALLQLLWTDIAANWFPPAQRLAGAHSRTYDFLHGHGYLDLQIALNGWLDDPKTKELDAIYGVQAKWHPPAELKELARKFPRQVRHSWGREVWESRTHYLLSDITLSCSASGYGGRMDMPLTVDLPGDRKSVRCYFIADGRGDPYGQNKIAAGPHQKAFHLDPLWTAAQRDGDALGLAIYRSKDIPTNAVTLDSNVVMPLDADSFRIGTRLVHFTKSKAAREAVKPGEVVSLRKGTAALAIRIPWSRGLNGRRANAELVFDGNEFDAVRLVVEHAPADPPPVVTTINPGAAFWLRIAGGFQDDGQFTRWLNEFAAARAEVESAPDRLNIQVSGTAGALELHAAVPWRPNGQINPAPSRAVLEVDGEDIGGKILRRIPAAK